MLFFSQALQPRETQSLTSTKRDKFRKEIRRSELRGRFQELRAKLLQDLNSENMLETMSKLRGGFNEQEFRAVVCGLEESCESAQFNTYAVTNKLEGMLLDILMNQEQLLTRVDASRVLYLLSLITYYSFDAVDNIIKQQDFIVEHLRKSMQKLQMNSVQDLKYFNQAISMLLNLTASFNSDFNKFLVQSGYCLMINKHLANTIVAARQSQNVYYRELVIEARVFSLKLFKNIVQQQNSFEQTTADLMRDILLDEENMIKYPYETLMLLTKAMENGYHKFWKRLTSSQFSSEFAVSIYNAFVFFQTGCEGKQFLQDPQACLSQQEKRNFYAMACFLNQLAYMQMAVQIDFQSTIENLLNGYMLAQFIIEADRDQKHEYLMEGIELLYHLSEMHDVTAEQMLIIRPVDDPLSVLKIIMNSKLLISSDTGSNCLSIMKNLLRKDCSMLKKLMEFNVIDKILAVLQGVDWQNALMGSILMRVTELATEVLLASRGTYEEEPVFGMMEQMGVLKQMEKLQEHRNREVYVKAEEFMHAISDDKRRH